MRCKEKREQCPLCERDVLLKNLTKHHLVPKSRGGKETEKVCRTCHRQLHALFTNKELEKELNSVEELTANEEVQKYLKWVRKKNPDRYFRADLPPERRKK